MPMLLSMLCLCCLLEIKIPDSRMNLLVEMVSKSPVIIMHDSTVTRPHSYHCADNPLCQFMWHLVAMINHLFRLNHRGHLKRIKWSGVFSNCPCNWKEFEKLKLVKVETCGIDSGNIRYETDVKVIIMKSKHETVKSKFKKWNITNPKL